MGMLEDDMQRPGYPCAKCGSRDHWESECFMNRPRDIVDTSKLGPIKKDGPSKTMQDASLVREALEAAAKVAAADEAECLIMLARIGHTETLAYIRRLIR